MSTTEATFFATADDFRQWLDKHHATEAEISVGIYKAKSGKSGITLAEAVEQALCYGWIDGVGRRIDDDRYRVRFTPRRKGSIWSVVNVERVAKLTELGLMRPAGIRAYEQRSEAKTGIYSHEQPGEPVLSDEFAARLRANEPVQTFFESQPPSYRKAAIWWVMNAKREDTRNRRLDTLIEDSAAGRRVKHLSRPG